MSGEVFSPPEPSRAKFTPSGRVFRLSRPLAWTLLICLCQMIFMDTLTMFPHFSTGLGWDELK